MTKSTRQRVPLSCLVCKKRKVKCDKIKPACGGCVKNGVPHLCEYLTPVWSYESDGKSSSASNPSKSLTVPVSNAHEVEINETIKRQRQEIDDLKRKLALAKQEAATKIPTLGAGGGGGAGISSSGTIGSDNIPSMNNKVINGKTPIVTKINNGNCDANSTSKAMISNMATRNTVGILKKLSPTKRLQVEVKDDMMLSIIKNKYLDYVEINSWVSIIRLDPQLNNLWYKIINLQKIYHLHKVNSLKKLASDTPNTPPSTIPASECPVMQIDLNVLARQSSLPSMVQTTMPSDPYFVRPIPYKGAGTHPDIKDEFDDTSDKGLVVLKQIQKIWQVTLSALREDKLSYSQVQFILTLFFNGESDKHQLSGLLLFYKDRIINLVGKGENDEALLSKLDEETSKSNVHGSLFLILRLKGIYMVMLSLIIEESLYMFRRRLKLKEESSVMKTFKMLFPNEVTLIGLGEKDSEVSLQVQKYLTTTVFLKLQSDEPDIEFFLRIPVLVCCILSMNHSIQMLNKTRSSSSFSLVFSLFIQSIVNTDNLPIWINPEILSMAPSGGKRTQEFQNHMCILWKETIRIANIVTFSLLPLVRVNDQIGDCLVKVLQHINESERNKFHTEFSNKVSKRRSDSNGQISFGSSFLIARIFNRLLSAITVNLTDKESLKQLAIECGVWITEENGTEGIRTIEEQVMLYYSRLFISYITMIQDEEDEQDEQDQSKDDVSTGNKERTSDNNKYVSVITKLSSMLVLIRKLISRLDSETFSSYLLLIIIEIMTRVIPIVSSIVMRISDPKEQNEGKEAKLLQIVTEKFPKVETENNISISSKLIQLTSSTIDQLRITYSFPEERVVLLSKVWNFYVVFLKHIHKISYSSYARIHANVPVFNLRMPGACPVRNIDGKGSVITNSIRAGAADVNLGTADGKCPIDYKSLKMGESMVHGVNGGKCPIDGVSSEKSDARDKNKKRKCPFNHELLSNYKGSKINAKESNIRGGNHYLTPTPPPLSPTPIVGSNILTLPTLVARVAEVPAIPPYKPETVVAPIANVAYDAAFTLPAMTEALKTEGEEFVDLLPGILNDFAELDFDFDSNLAFDFNPVQGDDLSINQLFQ